MTNYIGRDLDKISNIEILDNITFDGSQSYTLQKGGVNFTPNSAQSIILGIDGITQIGNFSVNGSTIDFGVAVANTSTCNYIIHLGTGLLTAPSDGSVTNAKLGTAPTLEAKGSGSTAGGVRYFCEQSSHHVTLRAGQHSGFSSGSFELKLPTAQGGANTFLKNDGSGNLSFAEAGGGCWTHLLTQTASNSSSLDFSSTYITTTYLDYMLVFSGMKFASDGRYPRLLFSVDNGSNYLSDYRNARMGLTDDNTNRNVSQTSSSGLYMTNELPVGNSTGEGYNAIAYVFDPLKQSGTTDMYTMMRSLGSYTDTSAKIGTFSGAHRNKVTTAVNNIRFNTDSGNITSGKVSLYGRKIS